MPQNGRGARWQELLGTVVCPAVAVCAFFFLADAQTPREALALVALALTFAWETLRHVRAYVGHEPQTSTQAVAPTHEEPSKAEAEPQTNQEAQGASSGDKSTPQAPAQQPADAPRTLADALARSEDVLATLRDLADQEGPEGELGRYGMLPSLLKGFGIETWHPEARIHCTTLARNDRFWLVAEGSPQKVELLRMASLEMTLNVWQDAFRSEAQAGGQKAAVPETPDPMAATQQVLARTAAAQPVTKASGLVRRADDAGQSCGEWRFRLDACDFLESVPTPYRTEFELYANLSKSLAVVDVAVPLPEQFSPVVPQDERSRCDAARNYALRSALLAGRAALQAARGVSRAVVNCRTAGSEDTLLSLDLDEQSLDRLLAATEPGSRGKTGQDPLLDPSVRSMMRSDGWLMPVTPYETSASKNLRPDKRYLWPELDSTPLSDAVQAVTGASSAQELGIHADANLIYAWNAVVPTLGGSTSQLVAGFSALRDATEDASVAEACARVCQSLVEGSIDSSDYHGIAECFVHGTPLHTACDALDKALEKPEDADALERALATLQEALSPYTSIATYADDTENVFRHFGSTAERVRYNLSNENDSRNVVLVPDSYYVANFLASRALGVLGHHDAALASAQEMVRVAPNSVDALLVEVRELEELSRTFEAESLLLKALDVACTDRELAVCYYRLAYMEWKLGRNQLAVACYQYAIGVHPAVAFQAIPEMQSLLASDQTIRHLEPQEIEAALAEGHIPTGLSEGKFDLIRDAAAACTDAGLFAPARSLVGELLDFRHDDVVVDVYRSLESPEG